jgi:uncharacterized protein
LEGAVPDITAKNIIENDIIPNFREGNYYGGLDAATSSIIAAAAGEYKAPEGYANRGRKGGGISMSKIIVALIIFWVVMGMFGGGNNRGGGLYVSSRIQRFWRAGDFPRWFWWRRRRRLWRRRRRFRRLRRW